MDYKDDTEDFEEFARKYNRPMPFCPWQGDMLYEKEIQYHLGNLERICKEFCKPSNMDFIDDPDSHIKQTKKELDGILTFLGCRNERTMYWGRLLLRKLEHPHPEQRYIEMREIVWTIFCFLGESRSFTWDVKK